ncbi:hypothetical protein CIW47_16950 [Mycolicibacterium sp. P1-5]|nr:hypothetical protein CIW47_16950 [Mycolicibacterium sp. P1-5]
MTGAALASAAAIVAASPSYLPTHDLAVGASTPLPVSTAKYALTAITDITIQGINDAYYFGWGGYVGCGAVDADGNCTNTPLDTYYPGVKNIYISGASGVLYYLVDNALESFVPSFDLDNYYFEIGAPAIPYVGSGELFGTGSPIFQAAQATFYYGLPNVANSIVASVAQLVPTFNLGPVALGGGILTSLFFYGSTPDGSFDYGTPGLSAVLAYISTSISDNLPGAPTAAGLSGAVSAATAAVEGVVKNFEGALTGATAANAATTAAKTPKTAAVAEVVKTESVTGGKTTEDTNSTGTPTTTEGTTPSGTGTTPAGTGTTTPSTDGTAAAGAGTTGSSTDGTPSSTADSTPAAPAKSTGAVAPKPTTSSTKATPKPAKPQNPLAKIGKQISDALGVGKKTKPESSPSSTSGTASNSSSTSSSNASSGDATK